MKIDFECYRTCAASIITAKLVRQLQSHGKVLHIENVQAHNKFHLGRFLVFESSCQRRKAILFIDLVYKFWVVFQEGLCDFKFTIT